jgi:aminoglycoside phosphotransferase
MFLKVGPGVNDEAARTAWLATTGLPAPAVLDAGSDGAAEWLVTAAVIGRPAHLPWPVDRRDAVVDALARITVALHALPVAECPFDRSLAVTLPVPAPRACPRPPRQSRKSRSATATCACPTCCSTRPARP